MVVEVRVRLGFRVRVCRGTGEVRLQFIVSFLFSLCFLLELNPHRPRWVYVRGVRQGGGNRQSTMSQLEWC
jgi:hypothetical protein